MDVATCCGNCAEASARVSGVCVARGAESTSLVICAPRSRTASSCSRSPSGCGSFASTGGFSASCRGSPGRRCSRWTASSLTATVGDRVLEERTSVHFDQQRVDGRRTPVPDPWLSSNHDRLRGRALGSRGLPASGTRALLGRCQGEPNCACPLGFALPARSAQVRDRTPGGGPPPHARDCTCMRALANGFEQARLPMNTGVFGRFAGCRWARSHP